MSMTRRKWSSSEKLEVVRDSEALGQAAASR